MSWLSKDKSWVNKIIFPAPRPPMYTKYSFNSMDPDRGTLCWIPRRQAPILRDGDEHDPNSVPCLVYRCSASRGGARKLVIFMHGNSEDLGNANVILSRMRDTLQMHVIGVEYSGYGISAGTPSESSLNNDLLVVYSFLVGALKWPPEDIILFGYSIGTGPATHLAARRKVGGLILIAPYTSIRDMVECVLPKGVGKVAQYLISNRFMNEKEIRSVTCPTLFVHGKADQLIPHSMSETLYKHCGSQRKKLYLAETLDHCFTDDDFEAFILFPLMEFFDFKRETGPLLELPPYTLTRPPDSDDDEPDADDEKKQQQGEEDPEKARARARARGKKPEFISTKPIENFQSELKKGAPPPDDPEHMAMEWQCLACTYVNHGHLKCTMCGAARGKPIEPWQCAVCTYENAFHEDSCEMCGTSRAGGPTAAASTAIPPQHSTSPSKSDDDGDQSSSSPRPMAFKRTQESVSLADSAAKLAEDLEQLSDRMVEWPCSACTLVNPPTVTRCVACGTPKPIESGQN